MQRRGQSHYPEKSNRNQTESCALCGGYKGDFAFRGNGFIRNRESHSARILTWRGVVCLYVRSQIPQHSACLIVIPQCARGSSSPGSIRGKQPVSTQQVLLHVCAFVCLCACVRVRLCVRKKSASVRLGDRRQGGGGGDCIKRNP